MLDIKWIRDNPDAFLKGLTDRGFDDPQATLNQILSLDEQRRGTIQQVQEAQGRRNAASKEIGQAMAAKDAAKAEALKQEVAHLKTAIQEGEANEREIELKYKDLLAAIPNTPAADVPVGIDAEANVELRKVGRAEEIRLPAEAAFRAWRGARADGFRDGGEALRRALRRAERRAGAARTRARPVHARFAYGEHGYTEINPPLLVRDDAMFGTAQLPKFELDQFQVPLIHFEQLVEAAKVPMLGTMSSVRQSFAKAYGREMTDEELAAHFFDAVKRDLAAGRRLYETEFGRASRYWLIPTAEVPLTNLVREEIVDEAKLPMRVTAWTPCFRAEAGAAGKDTRGMIRQHQFSKVELVSITTPEQSAAEHERMTKSAEEVLKRLELPFRTVVLSTGDMGFAANKTYDIEVWLPGQGTYREISSCSNTGDFQARRMNARYKPKGAKDTRFVHTLNGSGVAVGRALIAVLENYQEADGSIRIPDALKPYMGGLTKIAAKG